MGRKTEEEILLITQELRSLVKSGEILNYTEKDLEKKLKWTRKSIRKHLREIKAELGNRNIKIITLDFIQTMEIMMNDIKKLWLKARETGDERQILKYTNQMFKAWEKFADLLERFGIKPTAQQNIKLDAELNHNHYVVEVIDNRDKIIDVE